MRPSADYGDRTPTFPALFPSLQSPRTTLCLPSPSLECQAQYTCEAFSVYSRYFSSSFPKVCVGNLKNFRLRNSDDSGEIKMRKRTFLRLLLRQSETYLEFLFVLFFFHHSSSVLGSCSSKVTKVIKKLRYL